MNRSRTIIKFHVVALTAVAAIWAISAWAETGDAAHTHRHDGGAVHDDAAGTNGGSGKASDVTRTVRMDAGDTTFNVKRIQVRPGETIKFVITSKSSIPHEFVIASHDEHLEHRKMMQEMAGMKMNDEPNAITVDPGQTKELIWKFGQNKDVEFACDIPGHAERGMAGTFRVVK
jgi:uncharacterized cupredoxin-like copper-binding protein